MPPVTKPTQLSASEAMPDSSAEAPSTEPRRTRNTQQRQAVLQAVRALDGCHPTAAEVFAEVRRTHPRLSLATVYRALHSLVQNKELTELRVENVARFDAGKRLHHHVVCRHCGAVADVAELPYPTVARIARQLAQTADFTLDRQYPIQFAGLCPACRS